MKFPRLLERCTFPDPGTQLNCAVSGGADSLALMVLAIDAGCEVTAFHVDHRLRSGSGEEATIVRDAAVRFGAAFVALEVDVRDGDNIEARARKARFGVLPSDVVTGHTADDQAETIIVNSMRGAGIDGLSGMKRERHPILGLRRTETHALCAELGVEPVHDETNDDPRFVRNRVRSELLPLMNDIARRDIVPVLTRQADVLREEARVLDVLASAVDPTDAIALARLDAPVARRAVRNWLRHIVDDELHPPGGAAVERVLDVARNLTKGTDIGNGVRVTRSHQRLRAEPPEH